MFEYNVRQTSILGIVLKEMTEFESEHWGTACWAMLETIEMAFIGTILGVAISLPISIFAARNISNKYVYGPLRALLACLLYTSPSPRDRG